MSNLKKKFLDNYGILKLSYFIASFVGLLLCYFIGIDKYAKYISFVLIVMSIPFLFMEIKTKRLFELSKIKWIFAFLGCYLITIVLSAKTDIVSSIHVYAWLFIYMILFYSAGSENIKHDEKASQANRFFLIVSLISFIIVVIGIVTFLFQGEIPTKLFFLGGRVRSLTIDPIQLSWVCYIAITSSACNYVYPKINKKVKIFALINMLLSAIVLVPTMTRNTLYSLVAYVVILCFLLFYINIHKKNKNLRFIKAIICSFLVTGIVFGSYVISKPLIAQAPRQILKVFQSIGLEGTSEETNEKEDLPEMSGDLNRTDGGNFKYKLSGRFEIWCMGMNVVKQYPAFGVSSGDMIYQTVRINKGTELYNKTHPYFRDSVFMSQHNGFMQVLVASGVVGFVLTTGFLLIQSYSVLKYLFTKKFGKYDYFIAALAANVATVFYVLGIGQSISYFLISFISAFFWISLGYLMSLINKKTDITEVE